MRYVALCGGVRNATPPVRLRHLTRCIGGRRVTEHGIGIGRRGVAALGAGVALLALATGASAQGPALQNETPKKFARVDSTWDYTRREEMIPMRDGVKLHTVILIPRN